MRIVALVKRILIQIIRDKRTLALVFIAPLLVLTLMDLVFNGDPVEPVLGLENGNPSLITALKEADVIVKEYDSVNDIEEIIIEDDLDGFLLIENDEATLTLLNENPSTAKALEAKVKQTFNKELQQKNLENLGIPVTNNLEDPVETAYVYGTQETELYDTISPVLIGFFVFFFVFLIAGIGLINERTVGTLERLLATPIRRGEIVSSYLIGYGILAFLQTIIVVLFAIHILDIVLVGSIWHVLLINIIIALVALSLGILLSTFASSEFQMVQFIPIVIVPQIFFSGIFPLEGMADWLQAFAKLLPLYYAANALKGVMYKGYTLMDVSLNLYVLLAFATVFILLNLVALKKHRKL